MYNMVIPIEKTEDDRIPVGIARVMGIGGITLAKGVIVSVNQLCLDTL